MCIRDRRCTPDHWFLTQSAGYVEACNLKVGAKFIPEHEVKAVRFLSLEEAVPVYDISVEGYQNFLLSCGVVVHNSGKSFAAKRDVYKRQAIYQPAARLCVSLQRPAERKNVIYQTRCQEPYGASGTFFVDFL